MFFVLTLELYHLVCVPPSRAVFNMSGRRRLSFDSGGRWEGPMKLHLVVIGVGMNREMVLSTLEGMCVAPSAPRG